VGSVDGATAPVLDVADGAGEAVERMSLKFAACEGARGFGAANCVEDVVVEVVAGGGERPANAEG
jgi:hypothetical protein